MNPGTVDQEERGRSKHGRRKADHSEDAAAAVDAVLNNILIVDDSEEIRRSLRETLNNMSGIGTILEARDGIEGLGQVTRNPVDLIISDVNMPRLDGFKFVSAIRHDPRLKNVMIILLSSLSDPVDKIQGLTLGANDYVTKPFEQGELQARVGVMLKMRELQRELQKKNEAMEEINRKLALLANQDGLTGIPNRRYFFERFEVEFQRAQRLRSPLSCLMIDIDHFKAFNDRYGHLSGDEALRTIAGVLQESIRSYDLAGRYGGEELIVCLPNTGLQEAQLAAERLLKKVRSSTVRLAGNEGDGQPPQLTVSIGISSWPDFPSAQPHELVEAADAALYRAKEAGRNCCRVAAGKKAGEKPGTTPS